MNIKNLENRVIEWAEKQSDLCHGGSLIGLNKAVKDLRTERERLEHVKNLKFIGGPRHGGRVLFDTRLREYFSPSSADRGTHRYLLGSRRNTGEQALIHEELACYCVSEF